MGQPPGAFAPTTGCPPLRFSRMAKLPFPNAAFVSIFVRNARCRSSRVYPMVAMPRYCSAIAPFDGNPDRKWQMLRCAKPLIVILYTE